MKQIVKLFALVFLTTCSSAGFSQYTGLNFSVYSALEHLEEGEKIEINVCSHDSEFPDKLAEQNIQFTNYFKIYYRLLVGKQNLSFLSKTAMISSSEIIHEKPSILNDSMLSNNRVLAVHNADSGLKHAYSGKDVILGFIDTGIDFSHPDFQDSTGKTRVLKIWDQTADTLNSNRIPGFGYGQVWDSSDINNNACPHDDDVLSHGTNVAGIAAGNGLAINKFKGVAPESDIIFVASDFNASNWLNTVADGVEYIFKEADKLSKSCVINISAGTYLGSHDGSDLAAMRIDSAIKSKRGRVVVAAAGNSGALKYHLGYNVNSDTNFTWFEYNANSSLGYGSVYFQLWADTADFNQVEFSVGASKAAPSFQFRTNSPFDNIKNRLNVIKTDSLKVGQHLLGLVSTYAQLMNDKYLLEVNIAQPDSNQYLFSFLTTGNGKFDVWSDAWLGHSHIYNAVLPSVSQLPAIQFYKRPDSLQTIVSSFTCLPSVITVGNYVNRNSYIDVNNQLQTFSVIAGKKAENSSLGPNRKGYLKPDVIASGDYTLTANRLASIPLHIANNQSDRIAQGGKHKRNGGTSMAAPVVSGIAALLLEECNAMSASKVKSTIIQNSWRDSLSGNTANYSYGNGKVDGLSSLKSLYYQSDIIPGNDTILCGSNSLILTGPSHMIWYAWSTGDSTESTTVDSSIILSLMTEDSSGCISTQDTIEIAWFEEAMKPTIIRSNDTLVASIGNSYQWYQDGTELTGETSKELIVKSSGNYRVKVWDANGCSAESAPFYMALSVSEIEGQSLFKVMPNPVSNGLMRITFSEKRTNFNYSLYDSRMKLIRSASGKNGEVIDLSGYPSSLYFIRLYNEEVSELLKILVVN